jgi:hypothetical protein
MITESDRLAEALEVAGLLWPEVQGDRGALLRRVLDSGIDAVHSKHDNLESSRAAALDTIAGSMSGVWPDDWREGLRSEWPE